MSNQTFATIQDLNSSITTVTKYFGIYSRTNRVSSEVRLYVGSENLQTHIGFKIREVLGAIRYGEKTGRFHTSAQMMLDGLSGYQFAKLVVKMAHCKGTTHDYVLYINGKQSLNLPIE